ncbi:MAG: aldolase [Hyphomicrobiales bacterium]|nr:MAG: aldolase [Hyphomicrobiales bacterium]
MSDTKARDEIVRTSLSLFERGLTAGSTGNISVRTDYGWLMTPTGSSLGNLDPARLSQLDEAGRHIGGDKPTKEGSLHVALYRKRPKANAVVHLHSIHCVAVSCIHGLDPKDALPPLTAYQIMRVGRLPLVPYFPPGDENLARSVSDAAETSHAMLLANHGSVVAGQSLAQAADASEELEQAARLYLMLKDIPYKGLSKDEVKEIERLFPSSV